MRTLLPTLLEHDPGLLAIIAHRWDVDIDAVRDKQAGTQTLAAAMLEPARAAAEWARLNDAERGALQTLLSAADHKMPLAQFSRIFGEIRQIGPGRRDREKPHLNPVSVAETLYYRGLLALGIDQAKTGAQTFVYVPSDLADVLPAHETGFDLESEPVDGWQAEGTLTPNSVLPATTALVDDMATLLAFLQIFHVPTDPNALHFQVIKGAAPYWLTQDPDGVTALLIGLAGSMGLAASESGNFKPIPAHARQWLDQTRPRQVRGLAEAWRDTTLFNDLWHTPGLQPEDTGWRNDPLLARQTVLTFLEMAPPDLWWPVDDLIELVKAEETDFQRPAGDYDSWYIRDAATGEYLRGFESWDRVDGAVLRFILTGPLHWLGLVDLGDSGVLCRLTLYGRALIGETDWPDPPEERPHLTVEPDGTILAPRTLSRYERFQLARITEWETPGDPYTYRLTAASLQQAAQQGIQPDAIHAFLRRTSDHTLPDAVMRLLDKWEQTGEADVWMEHAIILRTQSPDTLDMILETPELRRYLGAALGPTAVIVREGQEHDLATALQQHGILVEF
jgi:hypothetical protein